MRNKIILSTDTMAWYGLDIIFEMAKNCWYNGIDLAISVWLKNMNYLCIQSKLPHY